MELSIIRATEDKSCLNDIDRLNIEAFPDNERVPTKKLLQFAKDGGELVAFYDKNEFIGFSYFKIGMGLTYICFLAVDRSKRCMGYGRAILELMEKTFPDNNLVLEIEPLDEKDAPNYHQRVRRDRFYKSCGFSDSGYKSAYMGLVFEVYYKGEDFDISTFYALLDSMRGGKFQPKVYKS
ncbi:MAG: GNAT family N-acetyltransferase [Oscillospiraceae bacterium]|nr:GNAT family N-acetyltransferase [Oscillospiraceae bacterium]